MEVAQVQARVVVALAGERRERRRVVAVVPRFQDGVYLELAVRELAELLENDTCAVHVGLKAHRHV